MLFYTPTAPLTGMVIAFLSSMLPRVPGVSAAKHFADYRCDRRIVTPRCEEIGMTVLAKHLRFVCILIFSLIKTISTTS